MMVIRAMIFDLDGTLVQTERLKALSYARAAVELCPYDVSEEDVVEAYEDVVGLPRRELATELVERFDLQEKAQARMDEFRVSVPWQAFVQVRLRYYEEMISDPRVLRDNQWPHNLKLLEIARDAGCKVALATMSDRERAQQVLEALELTDALDFIATRDDVKRGKPDPEIYELVSQELGIPPEQSLVIEDSPSGVEAALAAGMWCVAVTTPFTRQGIHNQGLLDDRWIVDAPEALPDVVQQMMMMTMMEQNR